MPITGLDVANFKGIGRRRQIDIRPITVFLGPNSSGKSTCIHALAALSQTVKLAGQDEAVVLDGENASVHLGRFIEVVHTRKYTDKIQLGVSVGSYSRAGISTPRLETVAGGTAVYSFGSTLRTQRVSLDAAEFMIDGQEYRVRRSKKDGYTLQVPAKKEAARVVPSRGIQLSYGPLDIGRLKDPAYLGLVQDLQAFIAHQAEVLRCLRNVLYLGPFRLPPQRRYPTRGGYPSEVGPQGEAAFTMMANEVVASQARRGVKQISAWLRDLGVASSVDVSRIGSSDLFDVKLKVDEKTTLPLADLGYGLSQITPVLAQCAYAPEGATLLFEQPELHLHPRAARRLARVFASVVAEKSATVVLETHAFDLVYSLCQELREGRISLDQVALYSVRRQDGETVLTPLDIDPESFEVYDLPQEGLTL